MLFHVIVALWLAFSPVGGEALAVADCETGGTYDMSLVGDLNIEGTGPSWGVMQLNEAVWRDELERAGFFWYDVISDPYVHAAAAKYAYDESERIFGDGWYIWSCKP